MQSWMFEAMCPGEVRGHQHLIIESVNRAIQVHFMIADLNGWDIKYWLQVRDSSTYSSRKGTVQAFQPIALQGVLAVRVGNCDSDLAAVRALTRNHFCHVYCLFWQEEERVANDVDLAACSDQQFVPYVGWDVGTVSIGSNNFGR